MNHAADAEFESLLEFLQQQRGFDFTGYKRPSLMRRVQRRMQDVGIAEFGQYRDYLEVHPDEFAQLFNTILINVTSFFRDKEAWDFVAREVIPRVAGGGRDGTVRVWSAGCASGEEAYTVAMLLAEQMGHTAFRDRAKIYATDVDEDALTHARHAIYSARDLEAVPPELRERYFEPAGTGFAFRTDLRRSVIFGRNDLVQDAPISRLDLLVCRNTLMYFNAETQARILARFNFALNGERTGPGFLFLGRAEMLLSNGRLFTPLEVKCRVFAKVPQPGHRRPQPMEAKPNENGDLMTRTMRLQEQALEESPVARIVVDANGALVVANQRARLIFSLNPKDVGRPLQELELSYRPADLRTLIEQAHHDRRPITLTAVERRLTERDSQYFDIIAQPLVDERQAPLGAAVTFLEVTRYQRLSEDLRRAQEAVHTANQELRSSNEEVETTNEELQSSNEELETTNEELQSTNEELETMNEELQSTNEELQAVNVELRQRTDDLHNANTFLEAVLGSLRMGAVVVTPNLDVLLWNRQAEDLWGLRADEVRGKSLLNLDIGLPVSELRGAIRACVVGDVEKSEDTLNAVNRRGKAIRCRISCRKIALPAAQGDGVIVTMEEMAPS